jgi:chromosome partitioning protein
MQNTLARFGRVLTVLNLKGGVGKTHAAWLLASVCQERSLRFLAVDLDTQGNLSGSFLRGRDGRPGVEALFDPAADVDVADLVRQTAYSHVDVIPGGAALARFDLSDQKQWEAADLHLSLVDAVGQLRGSYDYVVFDCPPRLSLVSYAALCASDGVIIPLEAADWGAQGIVSVGAAVRHVAARHNARLRLLGYLVSRFKRARAYQQGYLRQLREHFGELAFDTVIPDGARFEQSVTDRIPITVHSPGSAAAGVARAFFDEVARRVEGFGPGGGAGRPADLRRPAVAVTN